MELFLDDKLGKITIETDLVEKPKAVLILAHGAGAGMNHPSMIEISKKLNDSNYHCIRFNFPYMEQGRKSPGSPKNNIDTWRHVINYVQSEFKNLVLLVSGKSYGGRMASHLIAEDERIKVDGIIYFGFPLHAPGRDSKDRATHLDSIKKPQLFLQGVKDKLANIELMKEVVNKIPSAEMVEIDHADHSFNVPKKSGFTKEEIITRLIIEIDEWFAIVSPKK